MLMFLEDLWVFIRVRKKFWLAPIILVLLLQGVYFLSKSIVFDIFKNRDKKKKYIDESRHDNYTLW